MTLDRSKQVLMIACNGLLLGALVVYLVVMSGGWWL